MNACRKIHRLFRSAKRYRRPAVGQVVAALNGRFQVRDYVTSMYGGASRSCRMAAA